MFEVGNKINIKYKRRKKNANFFNKNGRIIGIYPSFILVQFKHHRECFRHNDLKVGLVEYKILR